VVYLHKDKQDAVFGGRQSKLKKYGEKIGATLADAEIKTNSWTEEIRKAGVIKMK
jgi:hypothetical protein